MRVQTIIDATLPFHLITNTLLSIATDATVGAVLQQYVQGCWQQLAYFSKSLKPAENIGYNIPSSETLIFQ